MKSANYGKRVKINITRYFIIAFGRFKSQNCGHEAAVVGQERKLKSANYGKRVKINITTSDAVKYIYNK